MHPHACARGKPPHVWRSKVQELWQNVAARACLWLIHDCEKLSVHGVRAARVHEPINILVTGKYRVGKSALINALFFEQGQ